MGYALGKVRVGVMAFILFFNPEKAGYSTALCSLQGSGSVCKRTRSNLCFLHLIPNLNQ